VLEDDDILSNSSNSLNSSDNDRKSKPVNYTIENNGAEIIEIKDIEDESD
jgi:hypothetical protein